MIYRVLRVINEWYALTVFWIFVAVFLMAFSLVFVFPLAPILLVFAGLGGLGVAVIGGKTLKGFQHMLARYAVNRGVCPACRMRATGSPGNSSWECSACHCRFDQGGCEIAHQPV